LSEITDVYLQDVPSDIVQIASVGSATLLMLGAQSVSALVRRRQGVIPSVLSRATCDCGIVIGKEKRFTSGTSTAESNHRIVLPLNCTAELSSHDQLALDTAALLANAPGATVVILAVRRLKLVLPSLEISDAWNSCSFQPEILHHRTC
jgi:hypothetical protein